MLYHTSTFGSTVPVPPCCPCAYSDTDVLPGRGLSHSGEPAVVLGKGWLEKMRKRLQYVTKKHEKTVIRQSLSCRKRAGVKTRRYLRISSPVCISVETADTPVSVQVFLEHFYRANFLTIFIMIMVNAAC